MTDDIIDRLRFWCELPKGAPLPDGDHINSWDNLIRAVCANAITEIEKLRDEVKTLRDRTANLGWQLDAVSNERDTFRDIKDRLGG